MNYMLESNHSLETCNPTVLIIVPTRELALQTRKEAQKFSYNTGIRAVEIYGGVTSLYQVSQIKNGCNILIATPGRLLDFLRRKTVSIKLVEFLILDEADRMLDMSFGKNIAEIIQKFGLPSKEYRHSLMFSATFPREVQQLAKDFLHDYFFLAVGQVGSANQDVSQNFYKVPKFDKRDKLVEILSESKLDRTIVFVEQKRVADFIASYLCQNDFPTTSIHGDRFQRERELALTDFRNGSCSILVATAVAARGLDIRDVKHVINYDLPKSIDEYVHRIGRTGRVGNLGKATSFYDRDVDLDLASSLVKILEDADQHIPEWLKSDGESAGYSYGQNPYINRFGASDIRRSNNQSDGPTSEIKTCNIGDDEDWDS